MLLSTMLYSALLAVNSPTWDVLQIGHLFGPPSISISGPKESSLAAEIIALLPPARIGSQPEESPPSAVVADINDDETVWLTIQLADIKEFLSLESGLNGSSTWSVVFEGAGAAELLEALKQKISPKDHWSWLQTRNGSLKCYVRESSGNPACILRGGLASR